MGKNEKRTEQAPKQDAAEKNRKKRGKLRLALIIIAAYLLIVTLAAVLIDWRHAEVTMLGNSTETIEACSTYQDAGAYAATEGRLFGRGRYLKLNVESTLDTSKPGTYKITYSTKYMGETVTAERTVIVRDNEPPVIELYSREDYKPNWLTGYEEEGFKATDNVDGDISDSVVCTEAEGKMLYTVSDSSGNTTTVERELAFLNAPVISLNNGEYISVFASYSFEDPGYTATDAAGNDLTSAVVVEGEVTPYSPGTYTLRYTLENKAGDKITAERIVEIKAVGTEDVYPGAKTIYLTFDDGPGPYTSGLLDLLARYGVKATFFVTNGYPSYANMIGRAYSEGHSIGVHTYTHEYSTIYSSEEAYFEDFNAMQDIIYAQTGSYTKLFRFPGGSSNTVSNITPGIMTALAADMTAMGFKYFDWNVTSGDAGETTKTDTVVSNIINGVSGKSCAVVLQHDIKDFSVAAVEEVIIWGRNNGYTFAALDLSSPGVHHEIAN